MKKLNLTLKTIVVVGGVLICSVLAHAQQRTFVSSTGNDVNPCTGSLPCRTFQRGHDAVMAGGEVVALDSAGYGMLSITKSVTITGAGVHAAVTATTVGANGVTITAAGATVVLRELTIRGGNVGLLGVEVAGAATVYIEQCVITGFGIGIHYAAKGRLLVADTTVRSNSGDGLWVKPLSGGVSSVTVDGSRFQENGDDGIDFDADNTAEGSITNTIMSGNDGEGLTISSFGNTRVQVAHSTAANNTGDGFRVNSNGAGQLNIEYSVARGNARGMVVGTGDTIRVSNSVVTNNGFGFVNAGGTFATRGNNTVDGNTTNLSGVLVTVNVH